MMQNFAESGLTFSFDEQWNVIKFDEHRFYKLLAGRGLKGVDFIGLFQEKTLVMMEVKNYIDRYEKDGINPTTVFLDNSDFYLQKVEQKFVDSLRLIQIIQRFYQRKWWFRALQHCQVHRLPFSFLLQFEWGFWMLIWRMIAEEKYQKMLWLELSSKAKQASFSNKHFTIINQTNNPFKSSLKVKSC